MEATVEHETGEDFGTLVLSLSRDDSATFANSYGTATIRVPLYSTEAAAIYAALAPLAATPEA